MKLDGLLLNVCIFYFILSQFQYNDKYSLVIFPLISKILEKNFYYSILFLSFVIYFKIEVDEKLLFKTKKIAQE